MGMRTTSSDTAGAKDWRTRLKIVATNLGLVAVSLALAYLAAEYVFFRHVLPHVTKDLRTYLPDRAEIHLQSAKAGYSPHDYLVLIGDSHAQGAGDWLWSNGFATDRPYHSAHVIRALAGNDVITLGRGGAGSPEAMVLRVSRIYGQSQCYLFPPIERPKHFFVYFYEGNDLYDNSRAVRRALRAGRGDLSARLDFVLEHDYGAQWQCHWHLAEMMQSMASYLIADTAAKLGNYVAGLLVRPASADDPLRGAALTAANGPPAGNKVMIGGVPVGAPELQIPPANLTDQQFDDGVAVYDRSLAWLRRHFPDIPATIVYIPAPAAAYRHVGDAVVAKDFGHRFLPDASAGAVAEGPSFAVGRIYEASQRLCQRIREISLRQGASFIDLRPAFRAAGARSPIHGPTDWNHPNEAGYRLIGAIVAEHVNDHPAQICEDIWPDAAGDRGQDAPRF